uniref:Uncharacterized protein n=1 Tax=Rhizophora mucronata TaxID=61149 RepID=A0A2P2PU96_RHIMU
MPRIPEEERGGVGWSSAFQSQCGGRWRR